MFWQRLFGRCIYRSDLGIQICQNLNYRWLTINSDAIQTLVYRKDPTIPILHYMQMMMLPIMLQPGDCCMLGLGGGGMVHGLLPYLGTHRLHVVEHCAEIIQISQQYFFLKNQPPLTIIQADATHFIAEAKRQYQHILIDLFDADAFPKQCHNETFFLQCQNRLLPGGVLAVNLANPIEQKPIFEIIKHQFRGKTILFPIKNCANIVILAYNGNSINPLLNSIKTKLSYSKLIWDAEWGYLAKLTTLTRV